MRSVSCVTIFLSCGVIVGLDAHEELEGVVLGCAIPRNLYCSLPLKVIDLRNPSYGMIRGGSVV